MKVLFVCKMNVGRSQMAEALYNQATKSLEADSAGVTVQKPGQTILERSYEKPGVKYIIDVMMEEGIDISQYKRKQLMPDMMGEYDLMVNMAEQNYCPDWLLQAKNVITWTIKDPKGLSYEITSATRDILKSYIDQLIADHKPGLPETPLAPVSGSGIAGILDKPNKHLPIS